jgi:hypothetical protein
MFFYRLLFQNNICMCEENSYFFVLERTEIDLSKNNDLNNVFLVLLVRNLLTLSEGLNSNIIDALVQGHRCVMLSISN